MGINVDPAGRDVSGVSGAASLLGSRVRILLRVAVFSVRSGTNNGLTAQLNSKRFYYFKNVCMQKILM